MYYSSKIYVLHTVYLQDHFILGMMKIKYCYLQGRRIDYVINRADATNYSCGENKVNPLLHCVKKYNAKDN